MKKLRTRKEFVDAIMNYYRRFYTDSSYPTIFSLQQLMLEKGICPRCGTPSRRWSLSTGYFPCFECGFKITEKELEKVYDDKNPKKWILDKRLKSKKDRKVSQ